MAERTPQIEPEIEPEIDHAREPAPPAVPPSERTRVRRLPERGVYDRDTIDAILDEALICHLAYVQDGEPRVIPTIHARVGDTLYVHGSNASRTLRSTKGGAPVAAEVTLIDGLVLARSAFHHSMNYRSVVVYGRAREVTDPTEKFEAQRALVEHVVPGRSADARLPNDRELNQTTILAIPMDEASAKVRTGPPKDEDEDLELPVWAGLLPFTTVPGEPVADPLLPNGIDPPSYVTDYRR
jgi:uncharacterized protein